MEELENSLVLSAFGLRSNDYKFELSDLKLVKNDSNIALLTGLKLRENRDSTYYDITRPFKMKIGFEFRNRQSAHLC